MPEIMLFTDLNIISSAIKQWLVAFSSAMVFGITSSWPKLLQYIHNYSELYPAHEEKPLVQHLPWSLGHCPWEGFKQGLLCISLSV